MELALRGLKENSLFQQLFQFVVLEHVSGLADLMDLLDQLLPGLDDHVPTLPLGLRVYFLLGLAHHQRCQEVELSRVAVCRL